VNTHASTISASIGGQKLLVHDAAVAVEDRLFLALPVIDHDPHALPSATRVEPQDRERVLDPVLDHAELVDRVEEVASGRSSAVAGRGGLARAGAVTGNGVGTSSTGAAYGARATGASTLSMVRAGECVLHGFGGHWGGTSARVAPSSATLMMVRAASRSPRSMESNTKRSSSTNDL